MPHQFVEALFCEVNNMSVRKKEDPWVREYEVKEPRSLGGAKVEMEVIRVTHPKGFPESSTSVVMRKRYKEFERLNAAMTQMNRDLHLKGTVPQLPRLPPR